MVKDFVASSRSRTARRAGVRVACGAAAEQAKLRHLCSAVCPACDRASVTRQRRQRRRWWWRRHSSSETDGPSREVVDAKERRQNTGRSYGQCARRSEVTLPGNLITPSSTCRYGHLRRRCRDPPRRPRHERRCISSRLILRLLTPSANNTCPHTPSPSRRLQASASGHRTTCPELRRRMLHKTNRVGPLPQRPLIGSAAAHFQLACLFLLRTASELSSARKCTSQGIPPGACRDAPAAER